MEWNQCFLCLANLDRGRSPLRNFHQVFKFLLHSESENNLKLTTDVDSDKDKLRLEACASCCEHFSSIQKLDSELEVVQMKLVDKIKTLRTRIISNSKQYGKNVNSKVKLTLIEEWLEEQNSNGFTNEPERKLLDDLYSFQTAVYNRAQESVEVPLIYLKAFSGLSGILVPAFTEADCDFDHDNLEQSEDGTKLEMKLENNFPLEENYLMGQLSLIEIPDITVNVLKRKRGGPASKKRPPPSKEPCSSIQPSNQQIGNADTKVEDYSPSPKRCRPSPKKLTPITPRVNSQRAAADVAKASIFLSSSAIKTDKKPQKTSKKTGDYIPRSYTTPSFAKRVKINRSPGKRHIFNCTLCPYTNLSHFRFEAHVREHEASIPEKTFACTECPEKFSTHLGLELHASFHSNFIRFRCEGCKEKVPPLELPSHLATHSGEIIRCPNCSYCSISREKYLSHLSLHPANAGNIKFVCDICSNNFPSKGALVLHLDTVHQAIEKYTCPYEGCGKSFPCKKSLKAHEYLHTKPQICKHCGKACSNSKKLERHMQMHIDKSLREPDIPCSKCSAKFFDRAQLKVHMMKFHGSSKFKCEPCGLEYLRKESLNAHNNLVHLGEKWTCTVEGCGVEYGSKRKLDQHTKRRHRTGPADVCEECGAQFRSYNGLRKHRAIHENKKEHVCPQCGRGFNSKEYLRGHMLLHNEEKKYVCEICGSGFKQKAALYLHRKRHKLPKDSEELIKDLKEK